MRRRQAPATSLVLEVWLLLGGECGHARLLVVRREGGVEDRALEAQALGLSFQPVGTLPYMARLLSGQAQEIYEPEERSRLQELEALFWSLFSEDRGRLPLLLFRLHRAPHAEAQSRRLPLERCVTLGRPIEVS